MPRSFPLPPAALHQRDWLSNTTVSLTLSKHRSHVDLGLEADALHRLSAGAESWVPTGLWLLHVSVNESEVFLERLYFSATSILYL